MRILPLAIAFVTVGAMASGETTERPSRAELDIREGITSLSAGGEKADAWVALQAGRINAWCAQFWASQAAADSCVKAQSAALRDYVAIWGSSQTDQVVDCQMSLIPRWVSILRCVAD